MVRKFPGFVSYFIPAGQFAPALLSSLTWTVLKLMMEVDDDADWG
jgi:hypothetical protein